MYLNSQIHTVNQKYIQYDKHNYNTFMDQRAHYNHIAATVHTGHRAT